jgi:hypothetical protein
VLETIQLRKLAGAERAAMFYIFFAMCKVNDIAPMQ